MAQRTNITMIDDIDGSEGAETTVFAFGGVEYEIDLNEKNFEEFSSAVAPYVEAARRVGGRRKNGRGKSSNKIAGDPQIAAMREWGRANGHQVSDRGRISAQLREAYAAAHA